jgi:hypothetical protein
MNPPDLRFERGSEEVGSVSDSPSPKRTSCQSRRPAGIGARRGCRDGNHDKRVFAVLPKENALSGAGGWHSEQLAQNRGRGIFLLDEVPVSLGGPPRWHADMSIRLYVSLWSSAVRRASPAT